MSNEVAKKFIDRVKQAFDRHPQHDNSIEIGHGIYDEGADEPYRIHFSESAEEAFATEDDALKAIESRGRRRES